MARTRTHRTAPHITADAAMAGVLALLIDEREARVKDEKTAAKTEVLLANAGVPVENIQALTGKTADAIRKAIQRSGGK
jgi:hypothetical protein